MNVFFSNALIFCVLACYSGCKSRNSQDSEAKEKRANPNVAPGEKAITPKTDEDRMNLIKKAGTWIGISRDGRSLLEGPAQKKEHNQFSLNQSFSCIFKEPSLEDPPGGLTPKFFCLDKNEKEFKVKYQGPIVKSGNAPASPLELNSGIFGEVISTRLFWAIGFPADAIYPVKVTCENCPEKPFAFLRDFVENKKTESDVIKAVPRDTRTFTDAVIEVKLNADRIERFKAQGWSWKDDFDFVNEDQKEQRDALTLLAAFIQHADNKAENQRFICMDESKEIGRTTCEKPILMIQDLGVSFGAGLPGGSAKSANLESFKKVPLWKDPAKCIVQVLALGSGFTFEKRVSEKGRAFLAEKLNTLTDQDLTDMFTAANLENNFDRSTKLRVPTDVSEWVKAFKARRDNVTNQKCPQ